MDLQSSLEQGAQAVPWGHLNPAALLGFVLGVTELHLAAAIGIFLGWKKKKDKEQIFSTNSLVSIPLLNI